MTVHKQDETKVRALILDSWTKLPKSLVAVFGDILLELSGTRCFICLALLADWSK